MQVLAAKEDSFEKEVKQVDLNERESLRASIEPEKQKNLILSQDEDNA